MVTLRIESVAAPYDAPGLGVRAARLLALAEAMGLLPPGPPLLRLDGDRLLERLRGIAAEGIGRTALAALETTTRPHAIATLLDRLYEELLASPAPRTEASALLTVLGADLVSALAGVSLSSLRRYAGGERTPADDVAERIHHLAVVTAHLGGAYNEYGMRRWFTRPRAQLGGREPAAMLPNGWRSDDPGPQQVLALAEALNSSPAT